MEFTQELILGILALVAVGGVFAITVSFSKNKSVKSIKQRGKNSHAYIDSDVRINQKDEKNEK
ncbi:hypothetical protein [Lysinibacillus sp. RS5]|uniref:hypothetical protein n=1 Tax=unclassified Lysinibacillus TaxID=2636778 RepID=UPI0035BE4151